MGPVTTAIHDEFFAIVNGIKPDRYDWLTPVLASPWPRRLERKETSSILFVFYRAADRTVSAECYFFSGIQQKCES